MPAGYRVADVADLVRGEAPVRWHDDVVGDGQTRGDGAVGVTEVVPGEGGDNAGPVQGRRDVDAGDPGVRHRAAEHRHVQHARQHDVVSPVGATGDQSRVLLAAQRLPDGVLARGRTLEHVGHRAPPCADPWAAAYCTDLTMF